MKTISWISAIAILGSIVNSLEAAEVAATKAVSPTTVVLTQGPTSPQWRAFSEWAMSNPILGGSLVAGGFALGVGLLTFIGVMISLWAASRRMRSQLHHAAKQSAQERSHSKNEAAQERRHSADEAHIERIATTRRTVYLEAVAELIKAQQYLATLAKIDINKVNIADGFQPFLIAVGRVAVVAELPTALKARALSAMFGEIYMRGLKLLIPIAKDRNDALFHDERYAATQTEIKGLLTAMLAVDNTRADAANRLEVLQGLFNHQQELAREHTEKSIAAKEKLASAEMQYSLVFINEMKVVTTQIDDLACAIRSELGLEANLEEFQRQTAALQERMENALKEIIASAR